VRAPNSVTRDVTKNGGTVTTLEPLVVPLIICSDDPRHWRQRHLAVPQACPPNDGATVVIIWLMVWFWMTCSPQ
jgi:hypothetical protein